jgi:ElaB/YqjD/DUF883 family membrane-anchored ribosome-binding protein
LLATFEESTMTDPRHDDPHTIEATARVVHTTDPGHATETPDSNPVNKLGEALKRFWSRGSTDAKELAATVREEAAIAGEHTQSYVRKEPFKAIAIAAGAGALVALMLRGTKRRG